MTTAEKAVVDAAEALVVAGEKAWKILHEAGEGMPDRRREDARKMVLEANTKLAKEVRALRASRAKAP